MPNNELKDIPEGKAGKGLRSLSPEVRNNMGFKMKPEVATYMQAAGNPAFLLDTDPDKIKKDFVSGNTITVDSSGTSLNTNVQGANTSSSETVKKSSGSEAFNKAYAAAKKKGGQGSKFIFNDKEYVVKDAPASTSTSSSSSSKPNVSTTKKTNISVDNIATPKLSEMEANMANIRHNNLVGEIKGISDSLTTRQYYKDLASLGRLSDDTKAEALNAFNNNNFTGPIKPGSYKGGFTRFNNIGPFADNEKFLDFVSGSAADKARASVGSDKKPQNIQKYMVSDGGIVSIDQNKNRKPGGPSTENVTGFTYEEIKKKSGEKTMQMAHTYFSRNKNKK